ncbi:MAG: purine-nucleoside phosphorylase [Endomicrobiaceae bacterium]|nr:purine-nucleoside phosphorylase [Endomicrobiaceae bacterium]
MKKTNIFNLLDESKKYIKGRTKYNPKIAVIIGSGLSNIKEKINNPDIIEYDKIPNFKKTTVEGHKGELVFGKLNSVEVVLLNGRFHYYEGYSMKDISYPVRLIKHIGVETLIITCAAGALNRKYEVGDIVAVNDHINFMFDNPLIGEYHKEFGERFPDLTDTYDKKLIQKAIKISKRNKIKMHKGTYFAVTGPSYETPAEVSAFSKLGGDVAGMSLVAESIAAKQMNMKVLALAYVSNKASGLSNEKLNHKDVLMLGKKAGIFIEKIIFNILKDV